MKRLTLTDIKRELTIRITENEKFLKKHDLQRETIEYINEKIEVYKTSLKLLEEY